MFRHQYQKLGRADLIVHGFAQRQNGGLIERAGNNFWVFDIDGMHQAARQRSLASAPSYPKARRRSQAANAKGYLGRDRGEVTRSTVAQAHTSEWLGILEHLAMGLLVQTCNEPVASSGTTCNITSWLSSSAIVRLDGYYGTPQFVNQIQQHQLGYLLRCRDYQLLKHLAIQTRLQETPIQLWSHPEAHQVREVLDLGFVDDSWAGYSQPVRLIVVRTPHGPKRKHRVGKRIGEFIDELFVTSHPQAGLTG
jgi:hypothetical protein